MAIAADGAVVCSPSAAWSADRRKTTEQGECSGRSMDGSLGSHGSPKAHPNQATSPPVASGPRGHATPQSDCHTAILAQRSRPQRQGQTFIRAMRGAVWGRSGTWSGRVLCMWACGQLPAASRQLPVASGQVAVHCQRAIWRAGGGAAMDGWATAAAPSRAAAVGGTRRLSPLPSAWPGAGLAERLQRTGYTSVRHRAGRKPAG